MSPHLRGREHLARETDATVRIVAKVSDPLRAHRRRRLFEKNWVEGLRDIQVTVELPGASKNDVSVECHDKVLSIQGEKRDECEEKDEHRHYVERSYGRFTRSFRMPADASEDVVASLRDGVLTVRVKKHEAKKPTVVSISD